MTKAVVVLVAFVPIVACNQVTGPRSSASAEACTAFGTTDYEAGSGISTNASADSTAMTLSFDKLRTSSADEPPEAASTLSVKLQPSGCDARVDVTLHGYCRAADMRRARPTLEIKWGGANWTGTPECSPDGEGFSLEARLDVSDSADAYFTARATLDTPEDAELSIGSIDLSLRK